MTRRHESRGWRPGVWGLGLLVLVGVFFVGSGPARGAPSDADRAQAIKLFRQANPQLYLGNYAKAVKLYNQALKLMPKMAGAWRNLGLAYEGLKQWKKAIDAYTQYIQIAGSSGRYYLAAQKRINVCRGKLGLPAITFSIIGKPGRLELKVNVSGAVVRVDGVRRGSTPTKLLPLNAGLHVVKLSKVGYLDWTSQVTVKSGQRVVLTVEMKKDPSYVPPRRVEGIKHVKAKNEAYLTVQTPASGIALYVDGKQLDPRSDGVFVLPRPKKHVVEVRAPGRLPWRARVELLRGEKKTLQPILPLVAQKKKFNRWGWVTLGVAGVLAGVGAIFSGLENGVYQKVADRDAASRAELDDLVSKGKTYRNVALGLYAGAAAALVGSIVLFVFERRGEHPRGRPLPLVIGPTGRGTGVALSFSSEVDF